MAKGKGHLAEESKTVSYQSFGKKSKIHNRTWFPSGHITYTEISRNGTGRKSGFLDDSGL